MNKVLDTLTAPLRQLWRTNPEAAPAPIVTPRVGLGRANLLDEIAIQWDVWDETIAPPEGWVWLKDNARPAVCLIRYSHGRLDRITRRDWYKAHQRLKRHTSLTEE